MLCLRLAAWKQSRNTLDLLQKVSRLLKSELTPNKDDVLMDHIINLTDEQSARLFSEWRSMNDDEKRAYARKVARFM